MLRPTTHVLLEAGCRLYHRVMVTLELRVSARCKACSVLTPVPGIRNQLTCRNCAAPINFAKRAEDSREGGLRYLRRLLRRRRRGSAAAEAAAVDAQLDDEGRLRLAGQAAAVLARRWATSPSSAVRVLAAKHPGSTAALLTSLAGDADAAVRRLVAARADTPPETLALLRKDPDPKVAKAVRKKPGYKPGLFEKLLG